MFTCLHVQCACVDIFYFANKTNPNNFDCISTLSSEMIKMVKMIKMIKMVKILKTMKRTQHTKLKSTKDHWKHRSMLHWLEQITTLMAIFHGRNISIPLLSMQTFDLSLTLSFHIQRTITKAKLEVCYG